MRDLVQHVPAFGLNEVSLLKVGRHFRLSPETKLVVGRDEGENRRIQLLAAGEDLLFEAKDVSGPISLLRCSGEAGEGAAEVAASITARYSDAEGPEVVVAFGTMAEGMTHKLRVPPLGEAVLDALRI